MLHRRAMKTWCAVATAGLAVGVGQRGASAQAALSVDMVEAHPPPTQRSFYGWQIIAVGEVGAVLVSASLVLPDRFLSTAPSAAAFIVGVPTYLLGAPIVHWSHDDFGKGLISLAANATLPVIGGVAGRAVACSGEHATDCAYRGFGAGLALTALVLPLVDALVLGWETVPLDARGATRRSTPSRLHGAAQRRAGGSRRGQAQRGWDVLTARRTTSTGQLFLRWMRWVPMVSSHSFPYPS
jgi:hypothetical protein